MKEKPTVTRVYQNPHLDSTRWRVYQPRSDDIVVSTAYKAGTTWTQMIIYGLLFPVVDENTPPLGIASLWLDERFVMPLEGVAALLEAQTHRRFTKTHLPLDGLPYFEEVKYVVVARDARDVFMSLWNHYANYTDDQYYRLNHDHGYETELIPRCPDDIHELWSQWMNKGWFEWESEGYPFWGNLHHTQTWWNYHNLPNILLIHYNALKEDIHGQVQRLADFLDIELSEEALDRVVHMAQFDNMKSFFKEHVDDQLKQGFKGGSDAFIYKGTNDRWKEVLTTSELQMYEQKKAEVLTPDCAEWLEYRV